MIWVQRNLEVIAQSDNRGLAAQRRARARARVRAGRAGCREHCHAFPESGSGLHSAVKASSYCTLAPSAPPSFLSRSSHTLDQSEMLDQVIIFASFLP